MRIVSKFKDYYDSALAYGHDETLTYVRKQEEVPFNDESIEKALNICPSFRDSHYRCTPFLVGFCGKFYFGMKAEYSSTWSRDFEKTFYAANTVDAYTRVIKDRGLRKSEMLYLKNAGFIWSHGKKRLTILDRYEKYFSQIMPDDDDLFFTFGTPIFLIRKACHLDSVPTQLILKTNPCLKDFMFFHVEDSFTTFQEIDMYLGGVLGTAHPPMVQISDIDMKQKKGFGHKYAFKKRPETAELVK